MNDTNLMLLTIQHKLLLSISFILTERNTHY